VKKPIIFLQLLKICLPFFIFKKLTTSRPRHFLGHRTTFVSQHCDVLDHEGSTTIIINLLFLFVEQYEER
jgi:hypothetical protein